MSLIEFDADDLIEPIADRGQSEQVRKSKAVSEGLPGSIGFELQGQDAFLRR